MIPGPFPNMKVHTLKRIMVDQLGTIPPGRVVDLHESVAEMFMSRGAVEPYETKVMREVPSEAAGEMPPSFASPVAPVSPQTTAIASEPGVRKRGRKPKAKSDE